MTITANGQLITLPTGYVNRVGSIQTGSSGDYHFIEYSGNTSNYAATGMFYQWGETPIGASTAVSVTLPLAYPSFVAGIILSIYLAGVDTTGDKFSLKVYNVSSTGFTVRNTHSSALNFNWFTIGS